MHERQCQRTRCRSLQKPVSRLGPSRRAPNHAPPRKILEVAHCNRLSVTKQHDRHTHCANHNGFDIPPERIARLQDDTREVNDAIPILRDRITVVVLTHNRCDELLRTLAHIQALPEQPAIVVVDNASTDGTTTCLASHRYKDVRLIKAERNLGAAGRNLGVNVVRTPYVAFCDDDTWWEPGALHIAVKLLDEHAQIAVLNANILVGPAARPDPACLACGVQTLCVIVCGGVQYAPGAFILHPGRA